MRVFLRCIGGNDNNAGETTNADHSDAVALVLTAFMENF